MDNFEKSIEEREILYGMFMDSDRQLITLDEYDLINGNVWNHLAEIGSFIFAYHQDDNFVESYRKLVVEFSKRLVDKYPEYIHMWSDLIAMCDLNIIQRA